MGSEPRRRGVLVTGRSIGSRKPLFADWSIPLTPEWGDGGELTLRMLIERLVATEVRAFNQRREERRLDRVLSAEAIEEGARRGRVAPEGRGTGPAAREDEAAAAALQAFEDGLYLVVIDEVERTDLEQPVRLKPDSRITLVRLTFLAGA
jgi:hypothetical protein